MYGVNWCDLSLGLNEIHILHISRASYMRWHILISLTPPKYTLFNDDIFMLSFPSPSYSIKVTYGHRVQQHSIIVHITPLSTFLNVYSPIHNDVEMGKVGLLNRYNRHLTGQLFIINGKQHILTYDVAIWHVNLRENTKFLLLKKYKIYATPFILVK